MINKTLIEIPLFSMLLFFVAISLDGANDFDFKQRQLELDIEKKNIEPQKYNLDLIKNEEGLERFQKQVKIQIKIKEEYWNYIFNLAELRGYKKQNEINFYNTKRIFDINLEEKVSLDLWLMKNDMNENGLKLNLNSGFRSFERQKNIFSEKLKKNCFDFEKILKGDCDKSIDTILRVSAPPGYSKHHTGRAIDVSCGDYYGLSNNFINTGCYKWLSENNFENSKKYNFYPSYPEGIKKQGPDPESWEFLWKK